MEILNGLAQGKALADLGVPESGFLNIDGRNITKENVEEFWTDLKVKTAAPAE